MGRDLSARERATSPVGDPRRMEALRATALLDALPDATFDRYTRMASHAVGSPVSLISLVDVDRQFFVSSLGLGEPWASRRQTPLSHSFCRHVVERDAPLVVPDAREDPLVAENGAVADLGVIAYAGVPLRTSEGLTLGSVCAIDSVPHAWSDADVAALEDVAASVMVELELRHALTEAHERELRLYDAASSIRALHAVVDSAGEERMAVEVEAGRAAADLAHELRTPLYAIRMISEDLASGAVTDLKAELEVIDASVSGALRVIDHQLKLAKERHGASLALTRVAPGELLGALRPMLEPLCPAGVRLQVRVAPDLPEVCTDELKLTQVLRNLTANALRHTSAGSVTIGAALASTDAARVCFTVADTGVGIAPEDLERIFEPYQQADGPQAAHGTGLGLTLARSMAAALHGSVTVESTLGAGSTFTLEVPVDAPA